MWKWPKVCSTYAACDSLLMPSTVTAAYRVQHAPTYRHRHELADQYHENSIRVFSNVNDHTERSWLLSPSSFEATSGEEGVDWCNPTHVLWETRGCRMQNMCQYLLSLVHDARTWQRDRSQISICWLGLLTCKNRLPRNLYCVGRDVKHCSIQSIAIGEITCHSCQPNSQIVA